MKKGDRNILLGVAIIACIVGAWYMGVFDQFITGLQQKDTTKIITDDDRQNYLNGLGRWYLIESCSDSLDPATTRTSATNYKLYWYTRQGSAWLYKGTGTGVYVTLEPADAGYLWVVMSIPSGQAFYVDYQKIVTTNQYIDSYLYTDVDGDGVKEFAFQYNMKGQQLPSSGYPSITFYGFITTYDASFTGFNDLTNDTAIGQTTNTQYYSYYLSASAAKKGIAIWKVEVKITTTDESKVKLKKLNVPNIGYLDGSAFDKIYTATDYRYVYTIARSFDGANYVTLASNANNRFDMTLSLEYTLANSDDILITTTVYYLVAQTEASTSCTESFYAQE